ncbi:MAG TPA: MFS transporter [Geminicoccaceae bacterium]|nr:MFS transporter [Geminicoccaceae bacterium]
MTDPTPQTSAAGDEPDRRILVPALGVTQILAWGSSYYLLAVLAAPIAADTGWSLAWVVGGLSIGLLAAGLVSPRVGGLIERHGGRNVLAASALLLAAGHSMLAMAWSLPVYVAAWVIMGLGMGAGLYDAAFATLGRIYGVAARGSIATLTLFGGLASTACWPLSALLVGHFGWRGACLVYVLVQLTLALPLYRLVLPRRPPAAARSAIGRESAWTRAATARRRPLLLLLAASVTVSTMIAGVISVHLLTMLQARGMPLAAAVALGAMVGPAQVAARAIEMAIGRYHHPVWIMLGSALLVAAGLAVLWSGLPWLALALILYGAGIGIESIARGTVPLALFGADGYAALMGRLALPSLVAQALSLWSAAFLLEWLGVQGLLDALLAAALVKVVLATALVVMSATVRR